MRLTQTQLPNKKFYETYDSEGERNRRRNELKNQWHKPEIWQYESISGKIYYIIYT